MVRASFDVRVGSASLRVWVRAASIRRAESLLKSRHPAGEVRIVFPIEPESFFVRNRDAAELVEFELPEKLAG